MLVNKASLLMPLGSVLGYGSSRAEVLLILYVICWPASMDAGMSINMVVRAWLL
jgi:hypothetical protein